MTLDELKQIMPHAGSRADTFHPHLVATMDEFGIDTPLRQAAFLAQLAHESGSLRYVRELASGGAYEGRADLGNTEPGDGIRYKGRGLIQITGRSNYQAVSDALGIDALNHPEVLELPENATRSAGWFWASRRLNELADREDFKLITKRINGGYNGYQDRLAYYERAKQVLGA
jgi:putative chitinase